MTTSLNCRELLPMPAPSVMSPLVVLALIVRFSVPLALGSRLPLTLTPPSVDVRTVFALTSTGPK